MARAPAPKNTGTEGDNGLPDKVVTHQAKNVPATNGNRSDSV